MTMVSLSTTTVRYFLSPVMACFLVTAVTAAENLKPPLSQEFAPSYNGWTSGAFWGGGYVQNVVLCPSDPNRCYTYIDMAGAYRSDDRGNTWRMLHGNFPIDAGVCIRGISVDPRNADRIIVVASSGSPWDKNSLGTIYRSEDGGNTFTVVYRMNVDNGGGKASGFIIDRKPGMADEIMVGSYAGVIRSTDNGKSWALIFPKAMNPTDLRFDRTNPERIWVCSPEFVYSKPQRNFFNDYERAFYRSDDGGKNWKKLASQSPTEIFQDPGDPKRLFGLFLERRVKLSMDGGETWTDLSKGLETRDIPNEDYWCLKNRYAALGGGKDFIVTANTLRDFYILKKGSDTWEKITIDSVDPRNYMGAHNIKTDFGKATGSITVDPNNPKHWYATDYYNVLQTFDSGKNWVCTSDGLSQIVVQNVFKFPGKHRFLVSMMDHTWYYSDDFGKTFKLQPGFGYERKYLAVSPVNPKIIYASGPRGGEVSISMDGGGNWWKPAQHGLPKNHFHYYRTAIAPDRFEPRTVYLAVANEFADGKGGGVYVSRDCGDNWERMSAGLPDLSCHAGKGFFENAPWGGNELVVALDGTPICISLVYNYAFYWDKTAQCWKESRRDPQHPWGLKDLKADPFSSRVWLAAGAQGLLYSDDSGKTWNAWEIFPGKNAGQLSFDQEKNGRFSVSSPQGLFLTEDGGKTWYFYNFEQRLPGRNGFMPVAFDGDHLLLGTPSSGVFYHLIERNADGSPKGFEKRIKQTLKYGIADFKMPLGCGIAQLFPGGVRVELSGKDKVVFPAVPQLNLIKVMNDNPRSYTTLGTPHLQVKPNTTYKIFFEARGNIRLTAYCYGKVRKDFLVNTLLSETWKEYTSTINVPADVSYLAVYLLNWQQSGWFEIRNFVMEEVK